MTDKLLDFIKDVKIDLTKAYFIPRNGKGYISNKFDITPKEFLRFAKLDLKQADERGYINSLTNSKRAIDCQIDEALDNVGIKHDNFNSNIQDFLIHFNFEDDIPIKLKIIHALNLAPSLLISKTRTLRNQLEHIYLKPTKTEVKEALDVAELFIRSVESKFKLFFNDFGLTDKKNYDYDNLMWNFRNGLIFNFDIEQLHFTISKIKNYTNEYEFIFNSNDKGYYAISRLMFSIDDNIDLEESLQVLLKQIGHVIPSDKVHIIQA